MANPAEIRIEAVRDSISKKFEDMNRKASLYWQIRDGLMEAEFQSGFHQHAYRLDKYNSGKSEAWEDFGYKIPILEEQLSSLKNDFGSIDAAFKEMKRNLLVETDAIIVSAHQIIKELLSIKSPKEIPYDGRVIRYPPYTCFPPIYFENEDDQDEVETVRVIDLIWQGRNQAHHYMDGIGPAAKQLVKIKEKLIRNIDENIHYHYSSDLEQFFIPEAQISMSDEVLRILGWRCFDDMKDDLIQYIEPKTGNN